MFNEYKPILDKITDFEKSFDVNTLEFSGIKAWPIVRMYIWFQMVKTKETVICEPQDNRPFAMPIRVSDPSLKPADVQAWKNAEFFFLSHIKNHSDIVDGKLYDRFIDPMVELIHSQYKYCKIDIRTSPENGSDMYDPVTVLEQPNTLESDNTHIASISHWVPFQKAAEEWFGFRFPELFFHPIFLRVYVYKLYFKKILEQINPKSVWVICWYQETSFGLVWACRELGIKTVDYQHGKQGKYHGMYSHWISIPKGGYSLMPEYFWNWGRKSADNIGKWFPENNQVHKTVVGGNRWTGLWKENPVKFSNSKLTTVKNFLAQFSKIIFVSLQPLGEDPFGEILLEAMAKSPPNWMWMCRIHPLHRHNIDKLKNILKSHNITNFEMDATTSLPLYDLFTLSTHHLTAFSSTCYESIQFNVPVAIFHKVGWQMYEEELSKGVFHKTTSSQEILKFITSINEIDPIESEHPYIETEKKIASEAISTILKG